MSHTSVSLTISTALLMIACQPAHTPGPDAAPVGVGRPAQPYVAQNPPDPDDPPDPPTCVTLVGCSFQFVGGTSTNPLSAQLHCGQQYRYMNGFHAGVLGGIGSFCPDSVGNRTILAAHHMAGFRAGYCDTCLTVPTGKLFVFWTEFVGPGCPSGCIPGEGAPPF